MKNSTADSWYNYSAVSISANTSYFINTSHSISSNATQTLSWRYYFNGSDGTMYNSSVFNIVRHIAHRIFFPTYISDDVLKARGFALEKIIKFPGLKEDIYLTDFRPDKNVLELLNTPSKNHVTIILRPPATEAHYHNPKSDQLMMQILEHIKKQSNLIVIIITRGEYQKRQFLDYKAHLDSFGEKFVIPERAVDTLSLLYYSDLMIGGGGTMNREAAALGIPTYSFFCGPMGEVDRYLQKIGKLHFITSEKDILKIKFKKKAFPIKKAK